MADRTIRAIIKLLVEGGHIPKEVSDQLRGMGSEAKKTQSAFGELGTQIKQALGLGVLSAFIKSSVTEFAQVDRAANALGFTLEHLGVGGAQDVKGIKEQLEALALGGGAAVRETIPAFQKFVGITHDTSAAMAATKLASDVAESGLVDFGTAVNGMVQLTQGRAKAAANLFGLQLRETGDAAKDNAALMEMLQKQVGGLGDAFSDSQNDIDRAGAQWERLKQIVGEGLAPVLKVLPDVIFHIIGGFKDLGAIAGAVFNEIIDLGRGVGQSLAAIFDFKKLATDPGAYFEKVKSVSEDAGKAIVDDWKYAWSQIVADHTQATAKIADNAEGMKKLVAQAAKASAGEQDKAAREAAEKRFDEESKALQDLLELQIAGTKEGSAKRLELEKQLIDEKERYEVEHARRVAASTVAVHAGAAQARANLDKAAALQREEQEKQDNDRLLQLQIDGLAEGTDARFAAEAFQLQQKYLAEVKAATEIGRDTNGIRLAYEKELANKTFAYLAQKQATELAMAQQVADSEREMRDAGFEEALVGIGENTEAWYRIQKQAIDAHFRDVEEDLNRQLDANKDAFLKGSDTAIQQQTILQNKLIANEEKHATAEKQITLSVTQYKAQRYLQAAATIVGSLQTVFGASKAFAIAQAVINTALAVTEVLQDKSIPNTYAKIALAVVVGLAGAAEVAKIAASNPGSGATGGGFGASASIAPSSGSASSRGSSGAGTGVVSASTGMVVPSSAPGKEDHPGKPSGIDTVPAWVAPGEIIADPSSSRDVLAGKAAIVSPAAAKGAGKPIVGGKLSLVPTKGSGPIKASDGVVVPGDDDRKPAGSEVGPSSRDLRGILARMAARADYGSEKGSSRQLGGKSFSTELLGRLGTALSGPAPAGSTGSDSSSSSSAEALSKVADRLEAALEKAGSRESSTVHDESITVHGSLIATDADVRELRRKLARSERLDSNRFVK